MVKAVVGDETQLKFVENRLTRSALPSQVGLVIGKLSSKLDRGFVYDLVPTPPNDAGEPPCSVIDGPGEINNSKKKNSSKAKSQSESSELCIDKDWVSEHARQVSRMLLGGIKVVGIYIWVNEGLFKNSTITLCQTVKGVAEAASLMMTGWSDGLLVHICHSPLRWTCKNCSLASNITSSTLRHCDFRMGKVLGSLQTFKCTYNFDVRLPVTHEAGWDIRRFSAVLCDEIMVHAKELTVAKALINGKLVAEDDPSVSDDFHEVEFLLPLLQDKYVEACSEKEVLGVLHFRGSVCSLAYLNSKEPVSQALVDIKEDITRSLQSRLELMCDEADRNLESVSCNGLETNSHVLSDKSDPHFDRQVQRKPCNLSFPRRVFIPWLEGTYICDYLLSSESMEVLQDHCVEVMLTEVPADASEILEPESEAPTVIASTNKTFWGIATEYSSTVKPDSSVSKNREIGSDKSFNWTDYKTILAISVLILSIVMGLVRYIFEAV
ncbi:protein odr-4 homolog [Phtheirospermum japonicum]|uniref:Protein odr-4 homolog n=1 Tax=Phtheirospermum japonicum TaxID=374723 RepID=A0A830D438_9LAMI|nr:protein odr-4 homolog [Phtheirospermum japonicum]